MKYLRYMGEFLSRAGVTWRVEILQEATEPFAEVGDLIFEADEALQIEYNDTDKEEVIQGSTATLQIESPGDRTYEDLYTIEVGRIRMDVYRENVLYWSGTLDPEFYEEPYEQAAHYVVNLTFSDFGILDRMKYDLSGMRTLMEILQYAINRSAINIAGLDVTNYCSTYFENKEAYGDKADVTTLSIRSENFFDEDGEASTLKEVIEGILQPLALRMVQRNGYIYIYDLNGLYKNAPARPIVWDGDSSTMGTDKVANNVKISFSPYSAAKLLDGDIEYGGKYTPDRTNLTSDLPKDYLEYGEYYSYYPDYSDEHRCGSSWDYALINFTIFLSNKGSGLAYLSPNAEYFHIVPMVGGPSETSGIAYFFYTGGHGDLGTGWPKKKINTSVGKGSDSVLMRTNRVFLPALTEEERKAYYVRVSLEMLLDARYNPFTEPTNGGNEDGNYNNMKVCTGWAFVPVAITLYDDQDNPVCHYDNSGIANKAAIGHLGYARGKWLPGAASFGDAWLEYYDVNDQQESAGILGWKANRHCIGRPDNLARINTTYFGSYNKFYIFDSFKKMADGEYIPYPEKSGYLEIIVYTGVRCFDYGEGNFVGPNAPGMGGHDLNFNTTYRWDKNGLYDKIRWLLYKAPKVEVVKNNLVFNEAELDDVEYSGYINKAAKEEISIDTICGTANMACPTAKGIYCRADDGQQIQMLTRAGVTDHPEKLLIGTMYSQYADRKTSLQGEAVIDTGALCVYTEQNQGDKKFILKGETQDLITDTTDATYVEFRPDEYEAIEEVTEP